MIKKLVFVSVPMNGKSNEEIEQELQKARNFYMMITKKNPKDVAFIDNYDFGKKDERYENETYKNSRLCYLGRAIKRLALCDEAVFGPGWMNAKGCVCEHKICATYDIPMVIMK